MSSPLHLDIGHREHFFGLNTILAAFPAVESTVVSLEGHERGVTSVDQPDIDPRTVVCIASPAMPADPYTLRAAA